MSLMEEEHGSGSVLPPANGAGNGEGSSTVVAVLTGVQNCTRHRHELVPELRFPPGYHFRPTDEELVDVYLRAKIEGRAPPLDIVKEVEILKFEPHVLVEKYKPYGENRWFFFTRREKSASNKKNEPRRQLYCMDGVRASWKATGSVVKILRSSGTKEEGQLIGIKRILVYHSNIANGDDDKWSMNEFVMTGYPGIDQWVLCTIQTKLKWDANSRSPNKQKKRVDHITKTKPKTTKRKKKTATSQEQEKIIGTFDDGSVYPPQLLIHEQDPHHQDPNEEGYLLALDNNNTSSIGHHQTLHEDYCQLEDLASRQQTYDMPNNLYATPLLTYQHNHYTVDYDLFRYQSQELTQSEYQFCQAQLQQQEEMHRYNSQTEMQIFVKNIATGSLSGQKHQDTSPQSVLENDSSSINLGEQQGVISGDLRGDVGDYFYK